MRIALNSEIVPAPCVGQQVARLIALRESCRQFAILPLCTRDRQRHTDPDRDHVRVRRPPLLVGNLPAPVRASVLLRDLDLRLGDPELAREHAQMRDVVQVVLGKRENLGLTRQSFVASGRPRSLVTQPARQPCDRNLLLPLSGENAVARLDQAARRR